MTRIDRSRSRRGLAVFVATVIAVSTYLAAPAHADATPVTTPLGPRSDVDLTQYDFSSQLIVMNESKSIIRVQYSDPTYGSQTVMINPGLDNGHAALCANPAYRDSNPVTVTFDPGTPNEITGTGRFVIQHSTMPLIVQTDLANAVKSLRKAKQQLRAAKRHHASSTKVRRAGKRVKSAKRILKVAQQAVQEVQASIDYCAKRKIG